MRLSPQSQLYQTRPRKRGFKKKFLSNGLVLWCRRT